MRRGEVIEGTVERYDYPGRGIVSAQGREVSLKGVLPGQKVRCRIKKANSSRCEAILLEITERSPMEIESACPHFPECGGCQMQSLACADQLKLKEAQIRSLLEEVLVDPAEGWFEGIKASPVETGYRNKMEFTFGDSYKDGPMVLGMHRKGSFYDIVDTTDCRIIDSDLRAIRSAVLELAERTALPYYHRMTHKGFFRHLLVRKAKATGQILADLVTTTQYATQLQNHNPASEQGISPSIQNPDLSTVQGISPSIQNHNPATVQGMPSSLQNPDLATVQRMVPSIQELDRMLVDTLTSLPLTGEIRGILHTFNDSVADTIQSDRTDLLYGSDTIEEKLLGMDFLITPFSFFQTNSAGAEVLYDTVRSYIGETKDKEIFDLYSGTGTIAQILAPVAKHVTGVEIVEEAVEAARKNAERNALSNCDFLCGDVLKVIDTLNRKPDMIVLDPPRDGIHPKAMPKILKFGADRIIYISCKATSLKRDLIPLQQAGYRVSRLSLIDLFPGTAHVECIALMTKGEG